MKDELYPEKHGAAVTTAPHIGAPAVTARSSFAGEDAPADSQGGLATRFHDQPGDLSRSIQRPMGLEYSAAVDAVTLVTTECIAVTSAMRKHARWAHSSVSAILGGSVSSSLGGGGSSGIGGIATGGFEPSSQLPSTPFAEGPGPNRRSWNPDVFRDGPQSGDFGATNRWGLRGKKGKSMQDNPLLSAFAQLRGELSRCSGMVWSCFFPLSTPPMCEHSGLSHVLSTAAPSPSCTAFLLVIHWLMDWLQRHPNL
jgi:hypothetical protein